MAASDTVLTRLTTPEISFSRPESWRSFPEPMGITPGPQLVVDVLTSSKANPCHETRNADGSGSSGCDWRVARGGVEVMWVLQALPVPMPSTTMVVAGRRAVRTEGPATGGCKAAGGARRLDIVLSGTGNARDRVDLLVHACVADPNAAASQALVDTMVSTLKP